MASKNEWVASSAEYLKPRTDGGNAWSEEAARQGGQGHQELRFAGETPAPSPVASAFALEADGAVIARRRLITLDGHPVELADTYYPLEIARGTPLAEPRKIKGGAVRRLVELGHHAARVIERVAARPAGEHERDQLRLGEHDPVVVIERLTLNATGAPIQFDVMVAPAALRRLQYEMKVS